MLIFFHINIIKFRTNGDLLVDRTWNKFADSITSYDGILRGRREYLTADEPSIWPAQAQIKTAARCKLVYRLHNSQEQVGIN